MPGYAREQYAMEHIKPSYAWDSTQSYGRGSMRDSPGKAGIWDLRTARQVGNSTLGYVWLQYARICMGAVRRNMLGSSIK